MRARLVCTALMLATLCATVQSEDTSHITTLSPEGAEKLICHDTQTRYVELVRRIRVPTCRQEERRREVNGETLTHWVTVHVVEEKHVPVRICCKGDLLALKELRELSVPAAAVLGNHNGILDLGGLEDLPPDVARALTQGNVRSLYLDGLETISHKTAEALLPFAGDVSLWSLKKVDLPTFETLRLRHSLPYAVTVEGSDNHVVNWGKREQRTIADCVVRLSVECGKPVTIAEDVLSKHNHGFADRLAAPPYTVMYRSEAIDWLASEISKDSPGTVVARDEGEGVRFVEKEKASP